MKKLVRKILTLGSITTLSVGLLTACGNDGGKAATKNAAGTDGKGGQEDTVKGIVIQSSLFKTPAYDNQLWLAVQTGLFEEEFSKDNITVQFSEFVNGPAANEALIADQIDIEHAVGDQPMITGIAGGSNGVALVTQSRQTATQGIYTGADSSIQSVQDLKGKRIGVGIGVFTHKCLVGVLESAGIKEDEVELFNLNSFDEQYSAYQNGDIDAFVTNYVGAYSLIKDGTVRQVEDFTSHPAFTFFVVRKDFIEEYPEITQRLINVLVRTQKWEEENPKEAAKLISELTGLDQEAILELRSQVDLNLDITEEDKAQIEWTYNFLQSHDYLSNNIEDISTIYDDSFIKKALETEAKETKN